MRHNLSVLSLGSMFRPSASCLSLVDATAQDHRLEDPPQSRRPSDPSKLFERGTRTQAVPGEHAHHAAIALSPHESDRHQPAVFQSFDLMEEQEEQPEVRVKCAACEETQKLCDHYKTQIAEFDMELVTAHALSKRAEFSTAQFFELQSEQSKRNEEVSELQSALSDAHAHLYAERQEVLKLNAENDQLQLQHEADRKKIADLLALTQPVQHEVTYFRNRPPVTKTVYHNEPQLPSHPNTRVEVEVETSPQPRKMPPQPQPDKSWRGADTQRRSIPKANKENCASKPKRGSFLKRRPSLPQPKQTLPLPQVRTVFLPSESADHLQRVIETLQQQLSEQAKLFKQRVSALVEEKRLCGVDHRAREEALHDRVRAVQSALEEKVALLRETTKDYLTLRRDTKRAQTDIMSERVRLARENAAFKYRYKSMRKHTHDLRQNLRAEATKRCEEFVSKYRKDSRDTRATLLSVQTEFDECKSTFSERSSSLESRLVALQKRYRMLEKRRNLELNGFAQEVKLIREQVHNLERVVGYMRRSDNNRTQKPPSRTTVSSDPHRCHKKKGKRDKQKGKVPIDPVSIEDLGDAEIQNIKRHLEKLMQRIDHD